MPIMIIILLVAVAGILSGLLEEFLFIKKKDEGAKWPKRNARTASFGLKKLNPGHDLACVE